MPPRRKTARKPKYQKKSWRAKRKNMDRALTIPNRIRQDYGCILRSTIEPNLSNGDTLDVVHLQTFQLNQCLNFTNYTAIFDQYRINMVKIKFIVAGADNINFPYDDTSSGTPGSFTEMPRYCVAIDRDDITSTSFDNLRARQHSWIRKASQPLEIKFKPNRLTGIYNASAIPGNLAYMVENSKKYLDAANNAVPHYGMKVALQPFREPDVFKIRMEISYYCSFANRRD